MNFFFLDPLKLGFTKMFIANWSQTMVYSISSNLPNIAIIGSFTDYMPLGFESTGVTVLVAIMNMATLGSGLITSQVLQTYGVGDGYYERVYNPFWVVCWISLGVNIVLPLFTSCKVKGLKKSAEKIENLSETVKQENEAKGYKSLNNADSKTQ